MDAVNKIFAFQETWLAEHGSYCTADDLIGLFDCQVLGPDIFLSTGGVLRLYLDQSKQAFVLLARDPAQWRYVTATSTGEIYYGWSESPDQSNYAAIRALVWAEEAMYAKNSRYGTLIELHDAGLLGQDWLPYMATSESAIALIGSGKLLILKVSSTGDYYHIVAEGGRDYQWTDTYRESIECMPVESDYNNALTLQTARNSLRTVISANAAHYASFGEYNTLPLLAERGFLDQRFADNELAELSGGIQLLVVLREGGQAYDAVSTVLGVMYYANEYGEVRGYALDEQISIPEIDDLRIRRNDISH